MRQLLLRWLPVGVWMALIFGVSSLPQLPRVAPPLWQELLSDGAHFVEYAILAGLLWRALRTAMSKALFWTYGLSLVVAAVYAASDEFHQSFVPGRDASVGDFSFDVAGAALALALLFLWRRRQARQHSLS